MTDQKSVLRDYLQAARDAVVWKLDGLSPYDQRRPMTHTGTNLLGILKHLAGVESGYLGATFDRPFPEPIPWMADDAELNSDMWASADESADDLIGLYRRVWAHSDATIDALDLDAVGHVPWWPAERNEVTLHLVLVRMVGETNRHAGHADIVRETIDAAAGYSAAQDNLPSTDEKWWADYRARLEETARTAQR